MMARWIVVALLLITSSADAQNYEHEIGQAGAAIAIDQANPQYPGNKVRRGQEGWVRMHFVVSRDGRAVDPIIIDSSGGVAFEHEARVVLEDWRFEAPDSGSELPDNLVNIRSEIERGRDAASSNFLRRYRSIMTRLHGGEIEDARLRIDDAYELGGWNLYESTMLWLMTGRIEGAEGNLEGKLEAYQRALGVSNSQSLGGKAKREALAKIFELQDQFGHYAHALSTFELLESENPASKEVLALKVRADAIAANLTSAPAIAARATIYNPCDCEAGEPLWYYRPGRRTFSFANLGGNVQRFEARCETHRISSDVVEGKSWTLLPQWGSCRVFVFGDDGASFDFLEHLRAEENDDAGDANVARHHVVD